MNCPNENDRTLSLESSRLILRAWQTADLAPFAALNADAEVMRYFPAPLSRSESDAMVGRINEGIAEKGFGLWAAELNETGDLVGMIGLHEPTDELPFTPCTEVGWRLARRFWGQGLATEGARTALAFAFGTLGRSEVVSFTSAINDRSISVMERLGMRRDHEGDFDHPRIPDRHELRRHVLYRISNSEFAP